MTALRCLTMQRSLPLQIVSTSTLRLRVPQTMSPSPPQYSVPLLLKNSCSSFKPRFVSLRQVRAFMPSCTPLMAYPAIASRSLKKEIIDRLEMSDYAEVTASPDCARIYYKVKSRTDNESKSSTVEGSPPLTRLLLKFVSPALLHFIPLTGFSVIDPKCSCVYHRPGGSSLDVVQPQGGARVGMAVEGLKNESCYPS